MTSTGGWAVQSVSTLGAIFILLAYVGLHLGKLVETSALYLSLNLAGALLLLIAALTTFQIGFILLEGAWVGITLYGFFRRAGQKNRAHH